MTHTRMTGPQLGFEPCRTCNKAARTSVGMVARLLAALSSVSFSRFSKMSTLALGTTWTLIHGVLRVL